MNGSVTKKLTDKSGWWYLDDDIMDQSEVFRRYDEMGLLYEEMLSCDEYTAPSIVAATLGRLFPENRECVRILDVAAGTGFCAVEFHKLGFRKMDALDGSKVMLQEAEKKNVYTRLIHDYLGENTLVIEDNTYDVVTISGMTTKIMENLPMHALTEVIRITRPGGYFMNAGYASSFRTQHLFWRNTKILEQQGFWKETAFEFIPKYNNVTDGALSIHQIC